MHIQMAEPLSFHSKSTMKTKHQDETLNLIEQIEQFLQQGQTNWREI